MSEFKLPETYTYKRFTDEEMEEFKELVKPLVKYLCDKHDPHTIIRIQWSSAVLLSERLGVPINDYID